MANSYVVAENPARTLLSSVLYKARRAAFSKKNIITSAREYGEYLKCFECDINLIVDAVKESKRENMVALLEELYEWYWKMDKIAAQA